VHVRAGGKLPDRGVPVAELIKKHKISSATFYNWKSKYGENKPGNGPKRGRPKGSGKSAAATMAAAAEYDAEA